MRDNYDFSDAVKNPFAGREKGKFKVTIHYDFSAGKQEAENNPDADKKPKRIKKPKTQHVVG